MHIETRHYFFGNHMLTCMHPVKSVRDVRKLVRDHSYGGHGIKLHRRVLDIPGVFETADGASILDIQGRPLGLLLE